MAVKLALLQYLHERRKQRTRTAAKPLEGPYYWVPKQDGGYELFSYPTEFYGENVIHTQVWERSTSEALGEMWGLGTEEVEQIKNHPYGIPRGRVSIGVGMIFINQGDDTGMSKDEVLRKISSEFGLQGLAARGKVKVVFDNHEVMQRRDKAAIESVLKTRPALTSRRRS